MPDPTEKKRVKRQVETIHDSQADLDEVDKFIDWTGKSAGRLYVEAIRVMINREKKAGRFV